MRELNYSHLTPEEVYTFGDRATQCIQGGNLSDSLADQLCERIKKHNAGLSKALGRNLKSSLTPAILIADEDRDKGYMGFRNYIGSFTYNSDPEKTEAANRLTEILHNQGWTLYRLSLPEESASLNALFAELDKPESQADIATLTATTWYADLKNFQIKFEEVYQERVTKDSEIDIPLMKESTKWLRFFLKGLLSHIEVSTELTPATYKVVSDKLDTIITDIAAIARARQTRKANEKAATAQVTGETSLSNN